MRTALFCAALFVTVATGSAWADGGDVDPLQLHFHRQSVGRFVFSQQIPFGRLEPSETVALDAMHPVLPASGSAPACQYRLNAGQLEIAAPGQESESAIYVSGVNPYAAYTLDVQAISDGSEAALEFATMDRATCVDVVLAPTGPNFLLLRIVQGGKVTREQPLGSAPALVAPYKIIVQLSGIGLAVFAEKEGKVTPLGRTDKKADFSDVIDFRARAILANSSFNLETHLAAGGRVTIQRAAAALSAGVGQADIRMVTHADGAPYIDQGRLWFTFSCRGDGTETCSQGVMSLDPSVFDPRLEGVIVFDRGDGLLRNDYASDLFYDDDAKEWRAFTCCFSAAKEGRGPSGLAVATSSRDPRHGLSVMTERQLDPAHLPLKHEDPCVVYDVAAGKWRLATSCFENGGIFVELFESAQWDGPYAKIAGPVPYNSTGTLIQKVGNKRYVFSGTEKGPSGKGGILAYSYPDLAFLGEVPYDLPAALKGGRIWPGIFPLPPGYPARYMSLTMDRANFPGIEGANWSYGALYLFRADTPDLNAPYEYAP